MEQIKKAKEEANKFIIKYPQYAFQLDVRLLYNMI